MNARQRRRHRVIWVVLAPLLLLLLVIAIAGRQRYPTTATETPIREENR